MGWRRQQNGLVVEMVDGGAALQGEGVGDTKLQLHSDVLETLVAIVQLY